MTTAAMIVMECIVAYELMASWVVTCVFDSGFKG
jgi:hypothetical protein